MAKQTKDLKTIIPQLQSLEALYNKQTLKGVFGVLLTTEKQETETQLVNKVRAKGLDTLAIETLVGGYVKSSATFIGVAQNAQTVEQTLAGKIAKAKSLKFAHQGDNQTLWIGAFDVSPLTSPPKGSAGGGRSGSIIGILFDVCASKRPTMIPEGQWAKWHSEPKINQECVLAKKNNDQLKTKIAEQAKNKHPGLAGFLAEAKFSCKQSEYACLQPARKALQDLLEQKNISHFEIRAQKYNPPSSGDLAESLASYSKGLVKASRAEFGTEETYNRAMKMSGVQVTAMEENRSISRVRNFEGGWVVLLPAEESSYDLALVSLWGKLIDAGQAIKVQESKNTKVIAGIEMVRIAARDSAIGHDFYLAKYEITENQFKKYDVRYRGQGSQLPITKLDVNQIENFISALNAKEKTNFRIPQAEEWTFVCQNGEDRPYPWGDAEPSCNIKHKNGAQLEHCSKALLGSPVKIATFQPTDQGIFDLIGNAGEVVLNSSNEYEMRGGSFLTTSGDCVEATPLIRRMDTGIRLALDLD